MPLNNPFCNIATLRAGQSSSETAKSGVSVVFDEECPSIPQVVITPWQKAAVWITEVTTAGFTWEGDEDVSSIDWIAIIRNG